MIAVPAHTTEMINTGLSAGTESSISRPLRILIDARKLSDGGIGVYIENLIYGILALNESKRTALTLGVIGSRSIIAGRPWEHQVEIVQDETKSYSLSEYFGLAKRLPLARYDVFHVPHFTLPFGITIPSVVTIHDLIHIQCPERFYYPFIARRLICSALRRASTIICVSEATGYAVRKLIRNDNSIVQKLNIVPNTLRPALSLNAGGETAVRSEIKNIHPGPYLLAVLSMHKPHKGIQDLLLAHRALRERGYAIDLVLVGKGSKDVQHDRRLASLLGEQQGVFCKGRVSDQELGSLYQSASGLVVPSLLEGFCIPALEARSFGLPVVARPVPALQEILGADDVVCSDMSQLALEHGMEILLKRSTSSSRAPGERSNGSGFMDFKDAALLTAHVYERAYESRPRS